jgi:hypothetical protein
MERIGIPHVLIVRHQSIFSVRHSWLENAKVKTAVLKIPIPLPDILLKGHYWS